MKEESEKSGLNATSKTQRSWHHWLYANRWGNNENSDRLYFLGLQNHCGWWLQPRNKRCLLIGRKAMTKLDSILKSRHHFANKGPYSLFPVVMYGCECWTIKKTEHQRTDAFELWCWRRLLRVPWTARRSKQSILKEINPEYSLEGLMLKLHNLATWGEVPTHWKRPWCWERLRAEGEEGNRG